jgi:hypothetical protein
MRSSSSLKNSFDFAFSSFALSSNLSRCSSASSFESGVRRFVSAGGENRRLNQRTPNHKAAKTSGTNQSHQGNACILSNSQLIFHYHTKDIWYQPVFFLRIRSRSQLIRLPLVCSPEHYRQDNKSQPLLENVHISSKQSCSGVCSFLANES